MARKSREQANRDWKLKKQRRRLFYLLGARCEVRNWMRQRLTRMQVVYEPNTLEGLVVRFGAVGGCMGTLQEGCYMEKAGLLEFRWHKRPYTVFTVTDAGYQLWYEAWKEK